MMIIPPFEAIDFHDKLLMKQQKTHKVPSLKITIANIYHLNTVMSFHTNNNIHKILRPKTDRPLDEKMQLLDIYQTF